MEGKTALAIAGIAATAALGIAGVTTNWLTARDDRAHQRALAHDDRVYDRRADTYLAALTLIQEQRFQIFKDWIRYLDEAAKIRKPATFPMSGDGDANLRARLTAFGSPRIVAAYGRLHSTADSLYLAEIFAAEKFIRSADEPEQRRRSIVAKLGRSLTTFDERKQQFERLVQRELS
jgi:hypothetical protein